MQRRPLLSDQTASLTPTCVIRSLNTPTANLAAKIENARNNVEFRYRLERLTAWANAVFVWIASSPHYSLALMK